MYTRLASIDSSSERRPKEITEVLAKSFTRKTQNLIRRTFTVDIRKFAALNAKSAFDTSQEHLLVNQSFEEQTYQPGDEPDADDYAFLQGRNDRALPHLPEDLILRISGLLDEVSLLCLKNTNTRFRHTITISEALISRCARWMVLCRLEEDIRNRDGSLPDQLACMYCKKPHPQKDFGVRNGNVGYGIERLLMIESCQPYFRYCWRYLPKIMNYSPGIENLDKRGRPSRRDKWVELLEAICFHCGDRLNLEENGQSECRTCNKECEVCGFGMLRGWERHGPQRPLGTYANIRFIRFGPDLEIRDVNGIRDLRKPLAPEPSIWRQGSVRFEIGQHLRVWCSYVAFNKCDHFSFINPIERQKERPGAKKILTV